MRITEILNFSKMTEATLTRTSPTDRVTALKDRGNQALRSGDVQGALEAYSQGLQEASSMSQEVPSKLVSQLFSNRAAVKLQKGDFDGAYADAKESVAHNESNLKGFYRAAKAALNLELFKESYDLCEQGLNLDPRSRDLQDIIIVCADRLGIERPASKIMTHSYTEEDARNCYDELQKLEEQCTLLAQRIRGKELEAARANRTSSVISEMGNVVCYKAIGRGFVKDDRSELLMDLNVKSKVALSELESLRDNNSTIRERRDAKERELKEITEYFNRKQTN
jgi:tetratricopeptide (TPR) repeat protein